MNEQIMPKFSMAITRFLSICQRSNCRHLQEKYERFRCSNSKDAIGCYKKEERFEKKKVPKNCQYYDDHFVIYGVTATTSSVEIDDNETL